MSGMRPVWLTREYRDALEKVAGTLSSTSDRRGLMHAVAAWDAAPADPAAVVYRVVRENTTATQAMCDAIAKAALDALGMPEDAS